MPAAVIGGAIAGVGSVASAAIGSSAASKAANASAAAADKSAAVQQNIYNQNAATLSPYVQAGLPATQTINALLGLGGTAGTAGTPGVQDFAAYTTSQPDLMADYQRYHSNMTPEQYGQYHYSTYGQAEGRTVPMTGGTAGTPSTDGSAAAQAAFDQYRKSTGYDFRVNQGLNAVNSGYAGRGSIKSGAAMKAINDYGQGMASQEFGNYLGALGNQQSLGMSAGSALAGVGQNYANSLGNIYQQNGANQANAALTKASAIGSGVNGLANIAGSILGGGSSNTLNGAAFTFPAAMNANSLYSGQTGNWQTWGN